MKLTMKNIAIPLGILWVVWVISGILEYEDSVIMNAMGTLVFVGIFLLIVTFFKERKQINKRQRLKKTKKINKDIEPIYNNIVDIIFHKLRLNPQYLFIATVIVIILSFFLKSSRIGFIITYVTLLSNMLFCFAGLVNWARGKKINKRNILISFLLVIVFVIIMGIYYPDLMTEYANSR